MRPVRYQWTGEVWKPFPAFAADCQAEFVEGEARWLDAIQDRSMANHRHYFAALSTAWATLPEDLALRFPTPKDLRKWCLIETGWFIEEQPFVMINPTAALRLCHLLSREYPDDRIYVDPGDTRVVRWKQAKSQSLKAMGAKAFKQSKEDVLNKCAQLIEVTPEELRSNAGKAA
jgi:hypothetical protein